MSRPHFARPSLALLAVLSACASRSDEPMDAGPSAGGAAPAWRTSFEHDAPGTLPAGWRPAETNGQGAPATWQVVGADAAAGGDHVVSVRTVNTGQTYNLLLSDAPHPADLTLSVRVLARSGVEDQGGGLVWRAQGPDDYLVARWNPLEDNVRLYTVVDGVRTQLAGATVRTGRDAWHELSVRAEGDRHVVAFDGEDLLRHLDDTFTAKGRIGLWTKADASTWFDELEVSPLR